MPSCRLGGRTRRPTRLRDRSRLRRCCPANVAVGFGLAGSGQATNIQPETGSAETAEAQTTNSSLIIDTFWAMGDASVSATFLDDQSQPQVESWTFLAAELRVSVGVTKGPGPTASPTLSPSPSPSK